MRKRRIWLFLVGGLALIIASAVVYTAYFGMSAVNLSKKRCENMVRVLDQVADRATLRADALALVNKYPTGGPHRLGTDEQPQDVKRVMEALGLGEAAVVDDVSFGHRILGLAAVGGFESYGVKIVPPGMSTAHATNVDGITELKWKDGVYVFCSD